MGQSTPDGLDCFECKVTGTLGSFAIGSYLWYNPSRGRYATRQNQKWALRLISLLPFYISTARWFYFPPFTSLKGHTLNELIEAFRARIRQVAEKHRIEQDYELTAEIVGQGLSSVFKAKGLRPASTRKEFAVKKIDVSRGTPVESRAATYRALTEARIAKSRCGHENTAGVEAVYCQDGAVFTVAKLVRPGNLLKAVTNLRLKGKLFCEAHVASIMKDIIAGLGHIHGQGLLHRDMKTANVLLGEDGVCMIVDFGESATGGPQRGTGVGTDGYRPPEAWGDEKQTKALDVYPLGIIAAECIAMRGAPQYYEDEPPRGVIAWVRRWLSGFSRPQPSPDFEDFLEKCLQHDAAARPTVAALLEHPFVKLADRSSLKELVANII